MGKYFVEFFKLVIMKRIENESFEQYRKRRRNAQSVIKKKLKGRVFFTGGTYVRPKRH